MCKLIPYLQGISVSASVNTLTALAFDRYLAICHVLHFKMTRKMARLVICFIWACAMVILFPWLLYYEHYDLHSSLQTISICIQSWPSDSLERGYFLGVIFIFCFTLPLLFISVFYALISWRVWHRKAPGNANASKVIQESKLKVVKMLIVVVILFAVFWLPLYAVNMRFYFGPTLNQDGLEFNVLTQTVVPISQWLGSSNSCVNPVVYCLFSLKFRIGFKELVHGWCRWWWRWRRWSRRGSDDPCFSSSKRSQRTCYSSAAAYGSFERRARNAQSASCSRQCQTPSRGMTIGQDLPLITLNGHVSLDGHSSMEEERCSLNGHNSIRSRHSSLDHIQDGPVAV